MGRMADARKKARRKRAAGAGVKPAPAAQPIEAPEPEAASVAAPPPPPEEGVLKEELPITGKIELPGSGLASEILAGEMADSTELTGEPSASAERENISFFSKPARDEQATIEETEHLATFQLDREEYGLPVRLVQEIIRVSEITQVPRAPRAIKGVINLRGRVIPVIDLRSQLGLGEVEPGRATRIVVVTFEGRLLGLLVDSASQVLRVPVSSIEAAPEEVVEIDSNYIRGVAKLEDRLIILIDLGTVLARELKDAGFPAGADAREGIS
jgi:purine-binding chemotaxis protein CheW